MIAQPVPAEAESTPSLAHRVFPAAVRSNTYDFDVQCILHANTEMRGEAQQDEEIFLSYGGDYERTYPVNKDACRAPKIAFISKDSPLIIDSRGSPEPLRLPALQGATSDIDQNRSANVIGGHT